MPKTPRQASYLQRRGTAWYFRFRLPRRIQSVAERSEIRVSLDTCELSIARERVAMLLPYVHSFKRLARTDEQTDARAYIEGTGPLLHGSRRGIGANQSTLVAAQRSHGQLSWRVHRSDYVTETEYMDDGHTPSIPAFQP